jgi:hypothetical protein
MIGIAITNLLKASADLMALISESKIFPYAADVDTDLPLIIYTIDSVDPEYSKDGWEDDLIAFSVKTYSVDYATLQSIVKKVRDALELKMITGSKRIILTGMAEGFNLSENVFVNKLAFKIEVCDYE